MAENKETPKEEVVVENKEEKQSDTPQLTEIEQEATSQGWVPKDKWDGAEDEWVSAKAFVKFGDVQSQLKHVKQESSQKEKVIRSMKEFYVRVKDDAKKEVLDTLKRQKREAIKQEDFAKVAELDLQLDELQTNLDSKFRVSDEQVQKVEATNVAPAPEFVEWSQKNKWYTPGDSTGMTADADTLGMAYAARNPKATSVDVLTYVETKIKQMYPDKFRNPEREKPLAVDDGEDRETPPPTSKRRVKLTEAEKQAADNFGMTHEAYAKGMDEWERQKGLK